MALTQPEFYFLVVPAFVCLAAILRKMAPEWVLLGIALGSVCFLAIVDLRSCILLGAMTVGNYSVLQAMATGRLSASKGRLAGAALCLLPLVYFKIAASHAEPWQGLPSDSIMPLGLAFYSLQQMTAILDVAKSRLHPPGFSNYLLFSFFFASLTSGPIISFKDMQGQLKANPNLSARASDIERGVGLLIVGLAKISLIANPIGSMVDALLAAGDMAPWFYFSITELVYLLWGSMLKFYFIFSAYSDMAVGIAFLFGIRLPPNFDSPLKAKSAQQYIASWHMSLMTFIREYVFLPTLMKVRRFSWWERSKVEAFAWACAVFVSFSVVGFWHAPDPTSVLISIGVAFLLVAAQLGAHLWRKTPANQSKLGIVGSGLQRVVLLSLISVCALKFTAPSLAILDLIAHTLLDSPSISLSPRLAGWIPLADWLPIRFDAFFPILAYSPWGSYPPPALTPGASLVHLGAASWIVFKSPNSLQLFCLGRYAAAPWRPSRPRAILLGALLALSVLLVDNSPAFVYGG